MRKPLLTSRRRQPYWFGSGKGSRDGSEKAAKSVFEGGPLRGCGTLGRQQRPDPNERGVDVGRLSLEIGEQVVRELG
jgi:hypothetical protein